MKQCIVVVIQLNEVYLYFDKLKFEMMADTTKIEYLADKKADYCVCKDNFHMEVDANSLTLKTLTRFVIRPVDE